MRLKLIFAVVVGLLLVAAPGCGSKKKAAATTKATTTQQTTATTTSTTTAGGLNLTNKDCANLLAAQSTIQKATTGKLPSDIAAQIAALQTLAKTAPAAIRGDFQVLADAAGKLSKLNVKPGQQPTAAQLQQLLATLDIAKLTTASQHIAAWAQTNCVKK
ncbi:MAG TPA: hypothetical protein VIJ84_07025 [Gaiellaceae bacterium]